MPNLGTFARKAGDGMRPANAFAAMSRRRSCLPRQVARIVRFDQNSAPRRPRTQAGRRIVLCRAQRFAAGSLPMIAARNLVANA